MRPLTIVIVHALFAVTTSHQGIALLAQEKLTLPKQWEYKAIVFSDDEKIATDQLNKIAASGWEYVGPLAHSMVAFRRPTNIREQILVEIEGRQPKTPQAGEKVAITVIVVDGDRNLLPGATVTVAAGGGDFLTKDGKPLPPEEYGEEHSNSVVGQTDIDGRFTAYWTARGGKYGLGITAKKKDYLNGRATLSIHFQR